MASVSLYDGLPVGRACVGPHLDDDAVGAQLRGSRSMELCLMKVWQLHQIKALILIYGALYDEGMGAPLKISLGSRKPIFIILISTDLC
eukprot:c12710_g1_i1 orf=110-376(+)